MSLPGYDAWKTTDPSQEGPTCPECGGWMYRDRHFELYCEDCEDRNFQPDEPDYEAWAKEQP